MPGRLKRVNLSRVDGGLGWGRGGLRTRNRIMRTAGVSGLFFRAPRAVGVREHRGSRCDLPLSPGV